MFYFDKMSNKKENLTGKVIELYIEGKVSEKVLGDFLLYIVNDYNAGRKDRALMKLWSDIEKPVTRATYKSLKEVKRRLGMDMGLRILTPKKMIWRVAAVLIPVLAVAGVLHLIFSGADQRDVLVAQEIRVLVPAGNVENIILPDGSEVWIRGGSEIAYPEGFYGERTVSLTGEAYFDVKKEERAFVVNAGDVVTNVLGTEFNISAFPEDEKVIVTLNEGKLKTSVGEEVFILSSGEQLSYNCVDSAAEVTRAENISASEWRSGVLSFNRNTVTEMMRICERHFGVKILVDGQPDETERFTTRFRPESDINDVMYVMQELTGLLGYHIKNDTVVIVMK